MEERILEPEATTATQPSEAILTKESAGTKLEKLPQRKPLRPGPILEEQLKQIPEQYHDQILRMAPKQRKLIFKKMGLKFSQIVKV